MNIEVGMFLKLTDTQKKQVRTTFSYAKIEAVSASIVDAYYTDDETAKNGKIFQITEFRGQTFCFHNYRTTL